MLKPALRIAAILAALLSPPPLAAAQSYELLHEGAGQNTRGVCFSREAAVLYLGALHFQMEVLGKTYADAARAVHPRMAGRVDINCYHLTSEATFGRAAQVIDIVEIDGLHPWSDLAMYGVMASRVVRSNGDLITRESAGGELYVVVSDFFVRKKP